MTTPRRAAATAALLGALLAGCASAPPANSRLEEARAARSLMQAEPAVARLAPVESRRAEEAFERAHDAWATRDDPALVDHLAYVARQRAHIARLAAQRAAHEQRLALRPVLAVSR